MSVLNISLFDGSKLHKHHHKLVAVNLHRNRLLLSHGLDRTHKLLVELLQHDLLRLAAQLLLTK